MYQLHIITILFKYCIHRVWFSVCGADEIYLRCFRRLSTAAQVVQHTGRPVQGQKQSGCGRIVLRPVLGMCGRTA